VGEGRPREGGLRVLFGCCDDRRLGVAVLLGAVDELVAVSERRFQPVAKGEVVLRRVVIAVGVRPVAVLVDLVQLDELQRPRTVVVVETPVLSDDRLVGVVGEADAGLYDVGCITEIDRAVHASDAARRAIKLLATAPTRSRRPQRVHPPPRRVSARAVLSETERDEGRA